MRLLPSLLLCTIAVVAWSDEIRLGVPTEPIPVRDYYQISVDGIADADLIKSSAEVTPSDGVMLMPGKYWGGSPYLLFRATKPGTYTITVDVNGWRQSLQQSIDHALPKLTDAEAVQLQKIAEQLEKQYPLRIGTAQIQVGDDDDPTPPPDDPDDPTPQLIDVTVIEEVLDRTQAETLVLESDQVHQWIEDNGHTIRQIDDDVTDADGRVPDGLRPFLDAVSGRKLPAVVIADRAGKIVGTFDLPTTPADFIKALKQYGSER